VARASLRLRRSAQRLKRRSPAHLGQGRLRGPAGAGKSSLAEALRQELGYPAAAIDTDLFNWTIVPGESNKRVVYDNLCLLAESYLRYGYDVVISGLILTYEEQGALASLRAKAGLLGFLSGTQTSS